MASKNERVINNHDVSANWEKAINFVPKAGEIIIYDDLGDMKIGDGKTPINDLSFYSQRNNNTEPKIYNGEGYLV